MTAGFYPGPILPGPISNRKGDDTLHSTGSVLLSYIFLLNQEFPSPLSCPFSALAKLPKHLHHPLSSQCLVLPVPQGN